MACDFKAHVTCVHMKQRFLTHQTIEDNLEIQVSVDIKIQVSVSVEIMVSTHL